MTKQFPWKRVAVYETKDGVRHNSVEFARQHLATCALIDFLMGCDCIKQLGTEAAHEIINHLMTNEGRRVLLEQVEANEALEKSVMGK